MIKRNDHQVFQYLLLRSCKGCSLGKLVSSRVLFLREQMRDLRVHEFLRELVVGIAAPGDLAGLFLVEILHCGEGENVKQVTRTLKYSLVFAIAQLSLNLLVLISCMLIIFVLIYYMLDIAYAP